MRTITSSLACMGLASVLLAGCGDTPSDSGDTPFTPEGVAGVYTLISEDGQPLPIQGGTEAGSLSLQAAGTYTISVTVGGEVDFTGAGTFTLVEPNTIQFTAGCCDIFDDFTGTLDGNQITSTEDGVTLVFQK